MISSSGDVTVKLKAYQLSLVDHDAAYLNALFEETHFCVSRAARLSGLDRSTIYRKAKFAGVRILPVGVPRRFWRKAG